jgi:antitoxin component YwqK of YwqJK toxin-antitoxin module
MGAAGVGRLPARHPLCSLAALEGTLLPLSLCLLLCPQATEVRHEAWPNGNPRAEYAVEVGPDGESREGEFRSWYEDGTLESEGKYKDDRRTGRWTFHHPDGSPSAEGSYSRGQETGNWELFHPGGERRGKGRYSKGLREGVWRFYQPDGSADEVETGTYTHESFRSPDGLRLFKGYRLDGERHGEWTSFWPDLSPQLEARFVRGKRSGNWVFHAPDGHVVTALSGRYEDDAFVGELPEDLAGGPAGALAEIESPPGQGLVAEVEVTSALDAFLGLPGTEPLQKWNDMVGRAEVPRWLREGLDGLPVLLRRLRVCDPTTEAGRREIGLLDHLGLRPLCGQRSLGSFDTGGPATAEEARAVLDGWTTLWAATRGDRWFWSVQVAHLPLSEPDRVLREPPIFGRDTTASALEVPFPSRFEPRRSDPREKALQAALDWLVREQFPDGHWGPQETRSGASGGKTGNEMGVTGLALLALMGAGNSPAGGRQAPAVSRAVAWILTQQADDGMLRSERSTHAWVYEHAIATQALAEAFELTRDPALAEPLRRAVDVSLQARNPYGAWRYDYPPIGNSDSSVTGWMLHALLAARRAGSTTDVQAALDDGATFLRQVWDFETGRAGYTEINQTSSRLVENQHFPVEKGEALTAVTLLAMQAVAIDREPLEGVFAKALDRITALPPEWDVEGNGIDVYYWFHATYALHHEGGRSWKNWEKALHAAVLPAQVAKGDAAGSWDPVTVWSLEGGRAYVTAMLALCLEVDFRFGGEEGR